MIPYHDLHERTEDERIAEIGKHASTGKLVAFITDDEEGKADRYISKLLSRFPDLEVKERLPGPVPNTVTVKVGLKASEKPHDN